MVLGVTPFSAVADWREFTPRAFENGAFVDVFGSYERDYFKGGGTPSREWYDEFLREKLTMFSDGYSYDPRFLVYHVSIAGLLRQENYHSSVTGSTGWGDATGLEYDTRFTLLPEHPYNLTVFATRYEPLFKEQAATQHNAVGNTYGVSFRYKKKPYFLHIGYVDNNIDSGSTSSDVQRVALDGQYFKRFVNGNEISFNGGYNPSWFSNSEGLDGSANEYTFGNIISLWQRVRLNSNFSENDFDQNSEGQHFSTNQLSWFELMHADLPWNFRTDLSYRYRDNESEFDEPAMNGVPASSQKLKDKGDDLQLDVGYRLYQSLDATYTFLRNSYEADGGNTTATTNSGTVTYSKSIPYGRVLAGASVGRSDTDSSGNGVGASDSFPGIAVPGGTFILRQQNVLLSSIMVFLKSPLPPFQFIELCEVGNPTCSSTTGENYQVTPIGNTAEIRILTVPPEFVVPGTYDFVVFYSLTSGNYTLQTDTTSANFSAPMFDNAVTPYVSYVRVKSSVESGVFPGTPLDSTTYTAGTILYREPFRVIGEYQKFDSNITPYDSYRMEVQYIAALNATANVYATASYLHKYYPHGTSGDANTGGVNPSIPGFSAYSEDSEAASASVDKQLPAWHMSMAASGAYSHLDGLVNANGYSANASWSWHIGKVDLTVGVNAYASDSSGSGTVATNRDHELLYFNVRRRLF